MIRVNEKWDVPWRKGMTVQDLLSAVRFSHRHIVVSVNGALVPPADYDTRAVPDEADVRVVHVIGGG